MQRTRSVLAATVVAGSLLAAACGSSSKTASSSASSVTSVAPSSTSMDTMGASNATGGASELRAGLTALLQEHVYLAGLAINQAVADKGDLTAPATKAAVAALDANSVALSDAVGSVYGKAGGDQFLALWRKHIGFFVDYTLGGATGDKAKQEKARADLDGYRNDFGAFLESATKGGLPKQAVADELTPHVQTLSAAIDAVLAHSPDVYAKLKTAADHMPMTAQILAGAISKQFPDKFAGDAAGSTATLRSGLTALLQEHVYLAGAAINQAVADKGDLTAPATKAAVAALDANSVALSDAVGSVYGKAGGDQFLALWRKHIGFFVDYTLGGATGDKAKQEKARADLDGYRNDFGAFLEGATKGGLPKQAVADELTPHVQTLSAAIDAVLAHSPDVYAKLKTAADHMPMTAQILAGAIAKQFPQKFAS